MCLNSFGDPSNSLLLFFLLIEKPSSSMLHKFDPEAFESIPSQVPGITVFKPLEARKEHKTVVSFSCANCGGGKAYSTEAGLLTCTFCGHQELRSEGNGPEVRQFSAAMPLAGQKHEFKLETLEHARESWAPGDVDIDCQQCGAHLTLPPQQLSLACPFCHSPKVIQQKRRDDALSPQVLIPLSVEAKDCEGPAHEWLGNHPLLPRDLQSSVRKAEFSPVYVPYWAFDAEATADWKARVGHDRTETYYENGQTKTRTVTVWKWENGRQERGFNNLLVSGSSHLDNRLLKQVDQFKLGELEEYDASFLAGIPAQAYEVGLEDAWKSGRNSIRSRMKEYCLDSTSTSKVRDFSMEMELEEEKWKYLLLPFLVASYQYEGETYQIIVNGQTGKLAGYRPVNWSKVTWIGILSFLPALITLIVGLYAPDPQPIMFGALVLAVAAGVAVYILLKEAKKLQG